MESVDLAIVGGGIGGLTLARALQGSGIETRIYEKVSRFGPVGAGIQIAPNASKLLYRLGLREPLEQAGVRPEAQIFSRWDDDGPLVTTSLRDVAAAFGAPHVTIHRADLHRVLLDGLAAFVETGAEIVRLERPDSTPRLSFADGRQVDARIVVGADGIHSIVRNMIAEDAPRYSGQSVFRGLVPRGRMPDARYADKVPPSRRRGAARAGRGVRIGRPVGPRSRQAAMAPRLRRARGCRAPLCDLTGDADRPKSKIGWRRAGAPRRVASWSDRLFTVLSPALQERQLTSTAAVTATIAAATGMAIAICALRTWFEDPPMALRDRLGGVFRSAS